MKVEQLPDRVRLSLEGEMTVHNASAFKKILTDSLRLNQCVELDMQDVGEIDLTCLQLICSAHRQAARERKKLLFAGPLPAPIIKTQHQAGFTFRGSCRFVANDTCLWLEENKK